MLTHLKKLKLIVRLQAAINIVLLFILVVYICQVIVFEYLDESHNTNHRSGYGAGVPSSGPDSETSENQPRACWFLWLTVCLVAVVIIPLQLTADAFLFKDMNDTFRSIQKYEQWLRVSALFLVVALLGVLLALFCPLGVGAGGIFLMVIILIGRLGSMYSARRYKRALECIVDQTTTIATSTACPSPSPGYGYGYGYGYPGANGDCRSITPTHANDNHNNPHSQALNPQLQLQY